MTNIDAPLEQEFLHIPVGKQEKMVKVGRIGNNALQEALLLSAFGALSYTASLPHPN